MPTTFWKDHNKEEGVSPDVAALREKYVADGRSVAGDLANDGDVLAVWLSGPFDLPRIHPDGDLHVAVLLDRAEHAFYRHAFPEFSPVGRRLEIAFFPIRYLRSALEKGCTDWSTLFDIHKLDDIIILYEREGVLSEMRRRRADCRPARLLVGAEIRTLKAELIAMERLLGEGRNEESILSARQILWHSVQLLLLAGRGLAFSKLSHLYPMLKSSAAPSVVRTFERVQAAQAPREEAASRIVAETAHFVRLLFERHGL